MVAAILSFDLPLKETKRIKRKEREKKSKKIFRLPGG